MAAPRPLGHPLDQCRHESPFDHERAGGGPDGDAQDHPVDDGNDSLLDAGLGAYFGKPTAAPEPAEEQVLPRILGDFEILREIGRGGMGTVYLAEQISLRRRIALKILRSSQSLPLDAVTRFRTEAAIIARLGHPGIVQVHAIGQLDRDYHFAMEFIAGSPLHDVIARLRTEGLGQLDAQSIHRAVSTAILEFAKATPTGNPETERATLDPAPARPKSYLETVCRLIARVADALQHAHDADIIHRDVKPSNILEIGRAHV